jgi:type II secretion system protein N
MIKKIAFALGTVLWAFLVFVVAFWMTFPSGKAARQLEYRVQEGSSGALALAVSSVSPWWVGVHASDAVLMQVPGTDAAPTQVVAADDVWVRASLFSLIGGAPSVDGVLDVSGARMWFDAQVDPESASGVASLALSSDAISIPAIATILLPFTGEGLSGAGDLALDLNLDMPDGLKLSEGKVRLTGKNITLNLAIPDPFSGEGTFDLGPVLIPELDIELDIVGGKATVDKGRIRSNYANIDLDGDIVLQDKVDRSRLRLQAAVSDLGEELKTFESLLSKAKQGDGKYHYRVECTVKRMGANCFKAARKRGKRPGGNARNNQSDGPRAKLDPEERRAKAAERAERRKKAKERREQGGNDHVRPGGGRVAIPADREEQDPDDEQYDDEMLDDGGDQGPDDEPMDNPVEPIIDGPNVPGGEPEPYYED